MRQAREILKGNTREVSKYLYDLMILSSFLGIFVLKLHYCYQVAKIISIFAVEKKMGKVDLIPLYHKDISKSHPFVIPEKNIQTDS